MTPQVRQNIAALPFNYSTWAVLLILWAADYWMGLTPERQQLYLQTYPWLQDLAMPAGALLFFAAKVAPQLGIKPIIAQPTAPDTGEVIGRAGAFQPTQPLPPRGLTLEETETVLRAAEILGRGR